MFSLEQPSHPCPWIPKGKVQRARLFSAVPNAGGNGHELEYRRFCLNTWSTFVLCGCWSAGPGCPEAVGFPPWTLHLAMGLGTLLWLALLEMGWDLPASAMLWFVTYGGRIQRVGKVFSKVKGTWSVCRPQDFKHSLQLPSGCFHWYGMLESA